METVAGMIADRFGFFIYPNPDNPEKLFATDLMIKKQVYLKVYLV